MLQLSLQEPVAPMLFLLGKWTMKSTLEKKEYLVYNDNHAGEPEVFADGLTIN